jgi:hypothetical protein
VLEENKAKVVFIQKTLYQQKNLWNFFTLIYLVLSIPLDLGGKQCGFVIVDDYSRFTWVLFLKHKDESFDAFKTFCKIV